MVEHDSHGGSLLAKFKWQYIIPGLVFFDKRTASQNVANSAPILASFGE